MMTVVTGTPGTGKSAVAEELERRGWMVVRAAETVGPFVLGDDPDRDTSVVDEEAWVRAFAPVAGIVEFTLPISSVRTEPGAPGQAGSLGRPSSNSESTRFTV